MIHEERIELSEGALAADRGRSEEGIEQWIDLARRAPVPGRRGEALERRREGVPAAFTGQPGLIDHCALLEGADFSVFLGLR